MSLDGITGLDEKDYLLHSCTLSSSFAEWDQMFAKVRLLRVFGKPALGCEGGSVGKERGIHQDEVWGLGDWGLK